MPYRGSGKNVLSIRIALPCSCLCEDLQSQLEAARVQQADLV